MEMRLDCNGSVGLDPIFIVVQFVSFAGAR